MRAERLRGDGDLRPPVKRVGGVEIEGMPIAQVPLSEISAESCVNMWVAVIHAHLRAAGGIMNRNVAGRLREIDWFEGRDFRDVCGLLGLDPGYTRAQCIRRLVQHETGEHRFGVERVMPPVNSKRDVVVALREAGGIPGAARLLGRSVDGTAAMAEHYGISAPEDKAA